MLTILSSRLVHWMGRITRSPARELRWYAGVFVLTCGLAPWCPRTQADTVLIAAAVVAVLVALVWQRSTWRWLLLSALVVMIGLVRYQTALPVALAQPAMVEHFDGVEGVVTGVIDEIDQRWDETHLTLNDPLLSRQALPARVLIVVPPSGTYQFGQTIRSVCQLRVPVVFDDFDYRRYLARYNIGWVCYSRDNLVTGGPKRGDYLLDRSRQWLSARLARTATEPANGLLQGMILGVPHALDTDHAAVMRALGLSHIIAISGSHIVLIVHIVLLVLIGLGLRRPQAFWSALVLIGVYVALVGAPASAVRAALMAGIFLLIQRLGRLSIVWPAALFAAAAMAWLEPMVIADDIGFQLSFAAVLGLVYYGPRLTRYLRWLPEAFELRQLASMTIAAQLATLPIALRYFGTFSPWSVLANLLILPVIPLLTVGGIAQTLAAALWVPAGTLIGVGTSLLVIYWVRIADMLVSWPYASLTVAAPSLTLSAIWYYGLWRLFRRLPWYTDDDL